MRAPFLFVDIEASSLSNRSYPIEIGWVDENGKGEAHLILPPSHWTDWSEEAERLHGISYGTLVREGLAADIVVERFLVVASNRRLVSDAPEFDKRWLERLCRQAGKKAPPVLPVETAWAEAMEKTLNAFTSPQEKADHAFSCLARAKQRAMTNSPVLHRAMADARHLWAVWSALSSPDF
ncbi:hypothetical protein JCM25156A_11890 [Komagataeibacter kakiaceti JCM 25156]